MSKWNMDPEVVCIGGGGIEVHPADHVKISRQSDGTMAHSDSLHVRAEVRVFLRGEDGFFAFSLTPGEAGALAAAVDRHCPDADPLDTAITGAA